MFLGKLLSWFVVKHEENVDQDKHKKETMKDKILSCAKHIIDHGELLEDNSCSVHVPSVTLKDDKGNTLYVSWFSRTLNIDCVKINTRYVPEGYDQKIFAMPQDKIRQLQLEYLEKMIDSVKYD